MLDIPICQGESFVSWNEDPLLTPSVIDMPKLTSEPSADVFGISKESSSRIDYAETVKLKSEEEIFTDP